MSTQVYKHTLRKIVELILASGRQTEIGFKRHHNLSIRVKPPKNGTVSPVFLSLKKGASKAMHS